MHSEHLALFLSLLPCASFGSKGPIVGREREREEKEGEIVREREKGKEGL